MPGEATWRQSCDREVGYVRNVVGVSDVSTLGKIDIQGPDAPAFLDFVYTNMFSTLKPGRVRYGLMLREDGVVMDDGTTACMAPHHYVMTTSTAAAGEVMRHLEFVRQCLCPSDGRAHHVRDRKLGAICRCGTKIADAVERGAGSADQQPELAVHVLW